MNKSLLIALSVLTVIVSGAAFADQTPEQVQCQKEAEQLNQQLAQCTTDECRRQVQALIDEHNKRCGGGLSATRGIARRGE